mgnify:CR=1 FL=1
MIQFFKQVVFILLANALIAWAHDKTEIMSYTLRERYSDEISNTLGSIYVFSHKKTDSTEQYGWFFRRMEKFADVDGDGIRAELDIDSDHANDNGIRDGDEDLNHNGIHDEEETDPYNVLDEIGRAHV